MRREWVILGQIGVTSLSKALKNKIGYFRKHFLIKSTLPFYPHFMNAIFNVYKVRSMVLVLGNNFVIIGYYFGGYMVLWVLTLLYVWTWVKEKKRKIEINFNFIKSDYNQKWHRFMKQISKDLNSRKFWIVVRSSDRDSIWVLIQQPLPTDWSLKCFLIWGA